jgi:four helix bundle protein
VGAGAKEEVMLRIYDVSLSVIRRLRGVVAVIERRDPDLARQLRRAASSVTLNLAEGSSSQGRNRNARYFNALGSAEEVRACIEVAVAFGYVERVDDALSAELGRIIGTLVRLIV